ncbi:MAG: GNAT family protein [Pseudomonadota bacterium]
MVELTSPGLEDGMIKLEPLHEAHREPLRESGAVEFMWASMPAIRRGAGFDVYFAHMLKQAATGETAPFALVDPRGNDRFVGVTAFIAPDKTHRRVSIGYTWLDPMLRGAGVYKSIQRLMLERAIEWGARRISWSIESQNERGLNAIRGLGAVEEGTLRSYERFADGQWMDITILSMLRDEAKKAVEILSRDVAAKLA